MTNPSRPLSHGRDAAAGLSFRVLNAFIAENPASAIRLTAPSVPPQIIISASPYFTIRAASPIEWAPVAHAVTTEIFGPWKPHLIEMFPAAILIIPLGIKNGLTRRGPPSCNSIQLS